MDLKGIRRALSAESGLLPGNRGFLLKPPGRPKAHVLLLHGFSASPWEVRNMLLHLKKRGYLVYAPRIAGHGSGRAAFDRGQRGRLDGQRRNRLCGAPQETGSEDDPDWA